ncbi:MAG TPA: DEAD/DEAH box helicase [Bacteroidales bacterium]|nr:DEAD/DEAH box helicase [Bacteroidales bacterium]
MKFSDFGLAEPLVEGLDAIGFEKPTPVQEQAIPIIMQKRDLIACAQTGTGKTAAFLLPVIDAIIKESAPGNSIKALIIAPTRELAIQIDQQLQGLAYFANISSIAVYGGGSGALFEQEKKALQQGADVVVATPGRLIAHLNLGYVDFGDLRFLVLDEADRMLDMGFLPDIHRIISHLPADRQSLLFSATMPDGIRKLASGILRQPEQISLSVSKPAENVRQSAYVVHEDQKIRLIEHLLQNDDFPLVLIFAGTRQLVKDAEWALKSRRVNVRAIHSDLSQEERNEVMNLFRAGQIRVLVATDIASRGIDVDNISLVINYNVPADAEDYVHRVGRTARAERTGEAITFVSQKEFSKFRRIESLLGITIEKRTIPASIGEGPQQQDNAPSEIGQKQPNKKGRRGSERSGPRRAGSRHRDDKNPSERPQHNKGQGTASAEGVRRKPKKRRKPRNPDGSNQNTA